MNFELTEDQEDLSRVLQDLVAKRSSSTAVRGLLDEDRTWDAELWRILAVELGVVGLNVPERFGGGGAGLTELAIVQEALGERLAMVPYLANLIATQALLVCATEQQQADWLPGLCHGQIASLAVAEGRSAWRVAETTVRAEPTSGGTVLTGRKDHVVAAELADVFVVPARRPDGQVQLFRVPADAVRAVVRPDAPLDPTRAAASVTFDRAIAQSVGVGEVDVEVALERVRMVAAIAMTAEQVGGMRQCVDLAVNHARTRVQFDRPIGGFQAVKHRCSDMHVRWVTAKASAHLATRSASAGNENADVAVWLAQGSTADSYYRVARDAIQVLGGLGCTWEHDIHFHLKRSMADRVLLGSPAETRERVARRL